jgi:hypothetical protein
MRLGRAPLLNQIDTGCTLIHKSRRESPLLFGGDESPLLFGEDESPLLFGGDASPPFFSGIFGHYLGF